MSPTLATAAPPAAVTRRTVSSAALASMSPTTTLAPSRANCTAPARPMPEPAAVIAATLPSSRMSVPPVPMIVVVAKSAAR